eukprot:365126-Chlamydomonas_euryale.AAC.4
MKGGDPSASVGEKARVRPCSPAHLQNNSRALGRSCLSGRQLAAVPVLMPTPLIPPTTCAIRALMSILEVVGVPWRCPDCRYTSPTAISPCPPPSSPRTPQAKDCTRG